MKRNASLRSAAITEQPYCLRCSTKNDLQAHHMHALADGGEDTLENISVICRRCHNEWHKIEGLIDYEDFLDTPPYSVIVKMMSDYPHLTLGEVKKHWQQSQWAQAFDLCRNQFRPPEDAPNPFKPTEGASQS